MQSSRMVKLKDKDKVKVKLCKTSFIEEDPPPAPPASGKQLSNVIARLSLEKLVSSLVTCRPPLCKIGFSLLGLIKLWCSLLGHNLLSSVGRFFPGVFKNF